MGKIPSQSTRISNHHIVYFNYLTVLLVNYTSVKLEKIQPFVYVICGLQALLSELSLAGPFHEFAVMWQRAGAPVCGLLLHVSLAHAFNSA